MGKDTREGEGEEVLVNDAEGGGEGARKGNGELKRQKGRERERKREKGGSVEEGVGGWRKRGDEGGNGENWRSGGSL